MQNKEAMNNNTSRTNWYGECYCEEADAVMRQLNGFLFGYLLRI